MRKDKRGCPPSHVPFYLHPPSYTLVIRQLKVLKRKILGRAEETARICSVKKVLLKFLQYTQENTCAGVFFLTKLQIFSLQLYQKKRLPYRCFTVYFANFKTIFFKYTFGWLLLIEGCISLKMVAIAIAINVSNTSYQREFVFFSYLRSPYGKSGLELGKKYCFVKKLD